MGDRLAPGTGVGGAFPKHNVQLMLLAGAAALIEMALATAPEIQ